jgi:hypothetical protein
MGIGRDAYIVAITMTFLLLTPTLTPRRSSPARQIVWRLV